MSSAATKKSKNTLYLLKQLKSHPGTYSPIKFNHSDPIKWYNCGPTVYSDSHMGHARNYLTIDILRRIVEGYFGLEVHFVQNITDLDDKLIRKVHEMRGAGHSESRSDAALLKNIAMEYEESYWKDMEALRVRKPNHILRVTEYMSEIQEMITKLLQDGFAYVGKDSGSIYFDTNKLTSEGYDYDQFGLCCTDAEQWRGGEEIIGIHEKHTARDFVLWKRDTSVFGFTFPGHVQGRPGWHIECSAMSSAVLGAHIDVHSGGVDLQFPHHTNEAAQSMAYHHTKMWVRDWIHVGHLHIEGLKMSKSTKNFTSIQEGLERYDARVIRMMSLQHHFADSVHYSADLMQHAQDTERLFREYFLKTAALIRHAPKLTPKPGIASIQLRQKLWETKDTVRDALLDNFDTPRALMAMADLVRHANRYEQQTGNTIQLDNILLQDVAVYLTQMFRVFGFMEDKVGYTSQLGGNDATAQIMDVFTQFRSDIRQLAAAGHALHSTEMQPFLTACDTVRNDALPELGVRIEDLPDGKSIWKFQDPEEIMKEIASQKEQDLLRQKHAALAREKLQKKIELSQIPPKEYYRTLFAEEYSQFDDEGLPTHDAQGEALSKSKQKKLKKVLDRHAAVYEKGSREEQV